MDSCKCIIHSCTEVFLCCRRCWQETFMKNLSWPNIITDDAVKLKSKLMEKINLKSKTVNWEEDSLYCWFDLLNAVFVKLVDSRFGILPLLPWMVDQICTVRWNYAWDRKWSNHFSENGRPLIWTLFYKGIILQSMKLT